MSVGNLRTSRKAWAHPINQQRTDEVNYVHTLMPVKPMDRTKACYTIFWINTNICFVYICIIAFDLKGKYRISIMKPSQLILVTYDCLDSNYQTKYIIEWSLPSSIMDWSYLFRRSRELCDFFLFFDWPMNFFIIFLLFWFFRLEISNVLPRDTSTIHIRLIRAFWLS